MEFKWLIISFVGLMVVVCGAIIVALRWTLLSSTEGAVNRLNEEIAKAETKQAELSKKLRQADEDLAKRQAEAKELALKMRQDAEEETKAEREKIVKKAREEGEAIIAKAKGAAAKVRQDLEKEFDIKVVHFSMKMLNYLLSQKAKGALDRVLVDEFLQRLKEVDMSRIGPEIKVVELITLTPPDEDLKKAFLTVLKEKLQRDIELKCVVDPNLGGGAILKFGSMALDGSVKNLLKESSTILRQEIENG